MQDVKLKKTITVPHLILYGVGTMIGAGIYVLIGVIAGYAEYYTPFAFLIAGFVGLLTAITYAELSHHFPYSAGAALYIHQGFQHKLLSKITGYLVILTGIVSCAALAKGFAGYAHELTAINKNILVFSIIIILGLIACWRINMSMWIISIVSMIEILGLIFIIIMLIPDFEIKTIYEKTLSLPSGHELFGLLNASLLAFYAFIGFEDMVNVVEEVKTNTMRRGIIYAFIITGIIYFLISLVTIASVEMKLLTNSEAPFAIMLSQKTPWASKLISVISIIATLNGALIQIIMASRVFYGMARKKIGIPFFAKVNSMTHTPIYSILVTTLIILVFAHFLPIEQLARLTSVIILFIFTLVNFAFIRMIRKKIIPKKRTIHLLLPGLALAACLSLFLSQIYLEIDKGF